MYKSKCIPVSTECNEFCVFNKGDEKQFAEWLDEHGFDYGFEVSPYEITQDGMFVRLHYIESQNGGEDELYKCEYGHYIDNGVKQPWKHRLSQREFEMEYADCGWL